MKKLTLLVMLLAASVYAAGPAPFEATLNSADSVTPYFEAFEANAQDYQLTFKDGANATDLSNHDVFMWWATSKRASGVVTASCSIVGNPTAGVALCSFSAGDLNYSNGIEKAFWGAGVANQPKTYKIGDFSIHADPYSRGAASITYTTNWNWGTISWIGRPNFLEDLSIQTGTAWGVTYPSNGHPVLVLNANDLGSAVSNEPRWVAASNSVFQRIGSNETLGSSLSLYTNRSATALQSNVYDAFVAALLVTNNWQSARILVTEGYTNRSASALQSNIYATFVTAQLDTNNWQSTFLALLSGYTNRAELALASSVWASAESTTNYAPRVQFNAATVALWAAIATTNSMAAETAARIGADTALSGVVETVQGYTNRAALALASSVWSTAQTEELSTNNAQSAQIIALQGYSNRAALALASSVWDTAQSAALATNNVQTALILAETSSRIGADSALSNSINTNVTALIASLSNKVAKTGDTMTGPMTNTAALFVGSTELKITGSSMYNFNSTQGATMMMDLEALALQGAWSVAGTLDSSGNITAPNLCYLSTLATITNKLWGASITNAAAVTTEVARATAAENLRLLKSGDTAGRLNATGMVVIASATADGATVVVNGEFTGGFSGWSNVNFVASANKAILQDGLTGYLAASNADTLAVGMYARLIYQLTGNATATVYISHGTQTFVTNGYVGVAGYWTQDFVCASAGGLCVTSTVVSGGLESLVVDSISLCQFTAGNLAVARQVSAGSILSPTITALQNTNAAEQAARIAADTNRVAKTGDTMSGALAIKADYGLPGQLSIYSNSSWATPGGKATFMAQESAFMILAYMDGGTASLTGTTNGWTVGGGKSMTANNFIGNASGLTNLNAANIAAGGTYAAGSGGAFTNLNGAAVTNVPALWTNDTITTVVGAGVTTSVTGNARTYTVTSADATNIGGYAVATITGATTNDRLALVPANTNGTLVWSNVAAGAVTEYDLIAGLTITNIMTNAVTGLPSKQAAGNYATGTPLYVETYTGSVGSVAGLATGTPLYAETYTGSVGSVAGLATGTPVYTESDPNAWTSIVFVSSSSNYHALVGRTIFYCDTNGGGTGSGTLTTNDFINTPSVTWTNIDGDMYATANNTNTPTAGSNVMRLVSWTFLDAAADVTGAYKTVWGAWQPFAVPLTEIGGFIQDGAGTATVEVLSRVPAGTFSTAATFTVSGAALTNAPIAYTVPASNAVGLRVLDGVSSTGTVAALFGWLPGVAGTAGTNGATGATGAQGPPGTNGVDGTTVNLTALSNDVVTAQTTGDVAHVRALQAQGLASNAYGQAIAPDGAAATNIPVAWTNNWRPQPGTNMTAVTNGQDITLSSSASGSGGDLTHLSNDVAWVSNAVNTWLASSNNMATVTNDFSAVLSLLASTDGGTSFYGLAASTFATGIPLYIETYTGSVGSVAGLATGTPLYVEWDLASTRTNIVAVSNVAAAALSGSVNASNLAVSANTAAQNPNAAALTNTIPAGVLGTNVYRNVGGLATTGTLTGITIYLSNTTNIGITGLGTTNISFFWPSTNSPARLPGNGE